MCLPSALITISCLDGLKFVAFVIVAIFPSIIEIKQFVSNEPFPICAVAPNIKIDLDCFEAGVC